MLCFTLAMTLAACADTGEAPAEQNPVECETCSDELVDLATRVNALELRVAAAHPAEAVDVAEDEAASEDPPPIEAEDTE